MLRGSRRDRGAAATAAELSGSRGKGSGGGRGLGGARRTTGLLSSSTDTSGSSSCGGEGAGVSAVGGGGGSGICIAEPSRAATVGSVQLSSDNLKDFKERVDSTIQQLSGLVSLLTSRESGVQLQLCNSSNRGDAACDSRASVICCCQCHAPATTASVGGECGGGGGGGGGGSGGSGGGGGGGSGILQSLAAPRPAMTLSSVLASRRQARSSRDFSAAISVTTPRRQQVGDSISDTTNDSAATTITEALACHRKPASAASGGIRFLWYDANRKRYTVRDADLICAKIVKRLHLSVHYFRVAGEDFLLLEKDCSDDGLAFIDTDNVVAFEGLSVEKVLKLQKLGCQLRPEELSREFAVEKGRSKYYVVPVEDDGGEWRLSDSGGAEKLSSLRRMLEQQEARKGGGGGGRKGGAGTAA